MKKITSFKKKKGSIYEITLNNQDKIQLYDDVILQYNLLLSKEIDDNKLKEILEFNSCLESYNIAIKYISYKLRTEKEIIKRLKNYSEKAIHYTLDRLKKEGYLNANLYIKFYINDVINLKAEGPYKIIYDLKKLGFKEEDITSYLDTIDKSIWLNKIDKFIVKRREINHNLSASLLKQKIIQELIKRGFSKDDVMMLIQEYEFKDDEDIYNKEYTKLKNKLSKKYSGKDLELYLQKELIKKGFHK